MLDRTAPRSSSRAGELLVTMGLIGLVVAIYAATARFGFVTVDDPSYVPSNPHVTGGLTWENVRWAFTSRWTGYWIPLTWISYMAEVQLFGVQPGVMHVTNLTLHAIDAVLLFYWLRRTTAAIWPAAAVAALFAVHPLHVESVAWVTERKDVLSTYFMLLALLTYTSYARRPSRWRYAVVAALFVAGLLAKPMLVTLPAVLLVADLWPLGRVGFDLAGADERARWRRAILEKIPLAALAAAAAVIVFFAQDDVGAMVPASVFPLSLRVENALVSTWLYLWQTIRPVDLVVWYAYPDAIPVWQAALAGVAIVVTALVLWRLRARAPYLIAGWAWYLVTLLPVSGLIQVGVQPRADRFTYVPLIGIFVMAAYGVAAIVARRGSLVLTRATAAATVVIVVVLAFAARQQVSYWRDGLTLWSHAAEATPARDGTQAQYELGRVLFNLGRRDEAIVAFNQAILTRPDWGLPYGERGLALAEKGLSVQALDDYETSLRLEPNQAGVHTNLGVLLTADGQFSAALPHFEEAVVLDPDLQTGALNLGITQWRLGRKDDAIRTLTSLLQRHPENRDARETRALIERAGK